MSRKHAQLTALCCECGTIRTTTTHGGYGEHLDPLGHLGTCTEYIFDRADWSPNRCTVWRKCATCKKRTCHAWVRDDEHRNDAEDRDHTNPRTVFAAWEEAERVLADIRALGVRVYFTDDGPHVDPYVAIVRWMDDGVYTAHVHASRSKWGGAHARRIALEQVWSELMRGFEEPDGYERWGVFGPDVDRGRRGHLWKGWYLVP